jgi:hypothetical protein
VDGSLLDMVLAGDHWQGVAYSMRPSRSDSREDGGAGDGSLKIVLL